jgi:hypothetical protein
VSADETPREQMMVPEELFLPRYLPPRIVTYTGEELTEQIGPAHTCSGAPCPLDAP